jgi:hypothetical protein
VKKEPDTVYSLFDLPLDSGSFSRFLEFERPLILNHPKALIWPKSREKHSEVLVTGEL